MKLAIVLTGHMRCWKQVLPNFASRFGGYNPDVFIHTWNEEGWWIPGDKHNTKGYHENTPKVSRNEIIDNYRPTEIKVENWDGYNIIFEDRAADYPNFAHRPKNILSMYYKLHMGVSLMNQHSAAMGKRYDLVLRMRPDMIFHEDLKLEQFDPMVMYTIPHRNHLGQGTGDMLQISSQSMMTMFSQLPVHMDMIYKETQLLCPHVCTKYWIDRLGYSHKEININKTIQHTPQGEYVEQPNWKQDVQK